MNAASNLLWNQIRDSRVLSGVEAQPGQIVLKLHAGPRVVIRGEGLTWACVDEDLGLVEAPMKESPEYQLQLSRDLADQAKLDGEPVQRDGRGRLFFLSHFHRGCAIFEVMDPGSLWRRQVVDVRTGQLEEAPKLARRREREFADAVKAL